MSFSRIEHMSVGGPNVSGNVLFLESAPDYWKAFARIPELTKEHPGYEIVIYRTSRLRPLGKKPGAIFVAREQPKSGRKSKYREQPEAQIINFSLYAIRPESFTEPDDDEWTAQVLSISNNNGQQGDPTIGGNHFIPPPTPPQG